MERVSIITHEGFKIAFLNAKELRNENELCDNINKLTDVVIANKVNLMLLDVTGTFTTPKVRDTAAKAAEKAYQSLGKVYSSLVGLSTLQRLIANVINRDQHFSPSIEESKKWLVSKANK